MSSFLGALQLPTGGSRGKKIHKLIKLLYRPYRVKTRNVNIEDYRQKARRIKETYKAKGRTNSVEYYERIASTLANMRRCEVRSTKDFFAPLPEGKFSVALRHDVDVDPFTAIQMADRLHQVNLPGTFFLLHTSFYYGERKAGIFIRNKNLVENLLIIQDKYQCEIGLHTDPYWVYSKYWMDGSTAVRVELEWLRELGFEIHGTSSHNSAPLYGAENFEIFTGRAVFNRFSFIHRLKLLPSQVIEEEKLGLSYEANFPNVSRTKKTRRLKDYLRGYPPDPACNYGWMYQYLVDNPYCEWRADYHVWLLSKDSWVIAGHSDKTKVFLWDVSLGQVADFLHDMAEHKYVMFNIHPLYI